MIVDAPRSRGWNIALWVAQIALAGLYLMAAYMKGLMPGAKAAPAAAAPTHAAAPTPAGNASMG